MKDMRAVPVNEFSGRFPAVVGIARQMRSLVDQQNLDVEILGQAPRDCCSSKSGTDNKPFAEY